VVNAQRNVTTNQTGQDGGMYFSFWTNGGGTVVMTLDGKDGYQVHWTNCGDFTCGKGWNPGSAHTVSYSGGYQNSGGGAFGLYGWTTNPLVEYYVCDSPGNSGSPAGGTHMGTFTTDGGTYDVYEHQQVNQPSIIGIATFEQYISVRQQHRTSGTITTQNHINAWSGHGMRMGTWNYQIILTEGWNGSGSSSASVRSLGFTTEQEEVVQ
jgi:endo-1,4-beta-xylanase